MCEMRITSGRTFGDALYFKDKRTKNQRHCYFTMTALLEVAELKVGPRLESDTVSGVYPLHHLWISDVSDYGKDARVDGKRTFKIA